MDDDVENIRGALTRWFERGQAEVALHSVSRLRNFWIRTGRTHEAWWYALGLSRGDLGPEALEQALHADGEMARSMHDYAAAKRQLEASLALTHSRGGVVPLTALHLGLVASGLGDLQAARDYYRRALEEFRVTGEQADVASSLNNLGAVQMQLNDFSGAQNTFEESLRLKRELGRDVEAALINLATLHQKLNNEVLSADYLTQALKGLIETGHYSLIPDALEGFGFVFAKQKNLRRAAVLWGATEAQRRALNASLTADEWSEFERGLTPIRIALGEMGFTDAWNEGHAMTLEQAAAYALELQP